MHLCRGPVSAQDAAYEAWEPMRQGSAVSASLTKEASDGRRDGGGENELPAGRARVAKHGGALSGRAPWAESSKAHRTWRA